MSEKESITFSGALRRAFLIFFPGFLVLRTAVDLVRGKSTFSAEFLGREAAGAFAAAVFAVLFWLIGRDAASPPKDEKEF